MKKINLLLALSFTAILFGCKPETKQETADTVFTNGKIYTVNEARPWAEAFAIKDGKFLAIGSNDEINAYVADATEVVDLKGQFTTPGFIDTHFHSVAASILTAEFNTGAAETNEEMYKMLREFAASLPEDRTEPLITYGWHLTNFPKEGPKKEDLDEIFGDLPVLFVRSDGHGAWANTAALKVANITKDTPDPTEQSYYQRDADGNPTGFIEEIPAYFGVYFPMVGDISEEWLESVVTKAFPKFPSVGLTTAFDPGVLFAQPIPAMNAVHAFNEKHGAVMRVSMSHYSVNQEDDFAAAQALINNSKSTDVYSNSIKINVDASIETGTGLLKEPYIEGSGYEGTGMTVFPIDEFKALVDKCYANNINMHFHVCGDAGIELVVDAMEASIAKHGKDKARANMTHAMMIDPADMPRFNDAQAGVSFSALWIMPGPSMDVNYDVVGDRADDFYPAGRVVQAGAKVGIGSDYPVATTFPSFAPLDNIEMFVTRARAGQEGALMQGKDIDKLSLEDAIKAATISNAWLMNGDKEFGSIEVGKSADFVVLEKNLFDVPSHEISKVKINGTYYKGNQTFSGN
ncbi:amidohydrolase [Reichenbachiella sp.]|uniref:amidohydrolase n=1 Tax=Reichenbachiella sp. TaxID=2184521 RepID=UPI003B5BB0CF